MWVNGSGSHTYPRSTRAENIWCISGEISMQPAVGANLVTDAHIAALAMEYQAEVHSNDTDFSRFPGLRWRNPL